MFSRSEIQNLVDGKPMQLALLTYKSIKCLIEIYEPRLLSDPSNQTQKSDPRGTLFTKPLSPPTENSSPCTKTEEKESLYSNLIKQDEETDQD